MYSACSLKMPKKFNQPIFWIFELKIGQCENMLLYEGKKFSPRVLGTGWVGRWRGGGARRRTREFSKFSRVLRVAAVASLVANLVDCWNGVAAGAAGAGRRPLGTRAARLGSLPRTPLLRPPPRQTPQRSQKSLLITKFCCARILI